MQTTEARRPAGAAGVTPVRPSWRDRLLPKTVLGLSMLLLSAAIDQLWSLLLLVRRSRILIRLVQKIVLLGRFLRRRFINNNAIVAGAQSRFAAGAPSYLRVGL